MVHTPGILPALSEMMASLSAFHDPYKMYGSGSPPPHFPSLRGRVPSSANRFSSDEGSPIFHPPVSKLKPCPHLESLFTPDCGAPEGVAVAQSRARLFLPRLRQGCSTQTVCTTQYGPGCLQQMENATLRVLSCWCPQSWSSWADSRAWLGQTKEPPSPASFPEVPSGNSQGGHEGSNSLCACHPYQVFKGILSPLPAWRLHLAIIFCQS